MSIQQRKSQRQEREARLPIVANLYKRGYSCRQIQAEVKKRLNLDSYGHSTAFRDIQYLLKEWREDRKETIDDALELELTRIDDTVKELWEQWEKSKLDYQRVSTTQKGSPRKPSKDRNGQAQGEGGIETYAVEQYKTNVVGLGNPQYISEIRAQLMERRKLLGLYAPEKKDISGEVSFASYLVESGLIDDAEGETSK